MIREIHIPGPLKKKLKSKKWLSGQIREKFYWCLDTLLKNPSYPSLRHKPIKGTADKWEFSITMNYRCVYRRVNDSAFILTIAKHEDTF